MTEKRPSRPPQSLMSDEGIAHVRDVVRERTGMELDDQDAAYIAGNIVEYLTRPVENGPSLPEEAT